METSSIGPDRLMEWEINKCLDFLKEGKTILYPTDTVWGLGCDATSFKAVEKIYSLKRRMEHKSLIILLDDSAKLVHYVQDIHPIAWDLLQGVGTPLTIIYPSGQNLAANVIADDGSIAIRITKDEFCRKLIQAFGKSIVSTSANITGTSTPLFFKNISPEIKENVDYIVSLYQNKLQAMKPSRIIRLFNNGEFEVIRQ
jgi:L-threonylcarbamoyladenylate synthase